MLIEFATLLSSALLPLQGCQATNGSQILVRNAASVEVRHQRKVDEGTGTCPYFVNLLGSDPSFQIEIRTPAAMDTVIARPGVETIRQLTRSETNPTIWNGTFLLVEDRTQRVRFQVTGVNREEEIEIVVARVPELQLAESRECEARSICLAKSGPTSVVLQATHPDEINLRSGASFLRNGQEVGRYDLKLLASKAVAIELPEKIGPLSIGETYDIKLTTREKFLDANGGWSVELPIRSIALRRESGVRELTFLPGNVEKTTVFVGETRIVDVHAQGLKSGAVYTLAEGAGASRRNVATLEVMQFTGTAGVFKARVTGASPTSQPFRHENMAAVSVMSGDEMAFHTHLQVVNPPTVERLEIRHALAAYTDEAVRPGERVVVRLTGKTLGAFITDSISSDQAKLVGRARLINDSQLVFDLNVMETAREVVPIRLVSAIARDTTLAIQVLAAQRPRRLDFASVSVPRRKRLFPFGGDSVKSEQLRSLDSPTVNLNSRYLTGINIGFEPKKIDTEGLYGVQYLILEGAYYDPDGKLVASDSARIMVRPEPNESYPVVSGYREVSSVRVDDLLQRLPRFATPGTYVEVRLRHDPARYQAINGDAVTVRVMDESRFRITPRFDVFTGLSYFARVLDREGNRQLVPNGTGTDTLVKYPKEKWTVDFLDVSGGASAAVDIDLLRSDFRPSLLRSRVGVFFVRDPFDAARTRRFGLAALYPIELLNIRGGIDLSIAVGVGRLLGGDNHTFGMVAPGVGFTLPRL